MTGLSIPRKIAIAFTRVAVGWVFLYAGLEKLFGAEPFSAMGFLKFGTIGTTSAQVAEGTVVNPTHDFWVALAGNGGTLHLPEVIVTLFGGSRSEARRKLAQGGVKLDGEALPADPLDVPAESLDGRVLQMGKRQYRRVRIS